MNIPLGSKNDSNMPVAALDSPEQVYPGTWLRFDIGSDPGIPSEGEITFKYCVRRKSIETKADHDGRVEYSVDLKAITNMSAESRKEKVKSAEEALDELYKEKGD